MGGLVLTRPSRRNRQKDARDSPGRGPGDVQVARGGRRGPAGQLAAVCAVELSDDFGMFFLLWVWLEGGLLVVIVPAPHRVVDSFTSPHPLHLLHEQPR